MAKFEVPELQFPHWAEALKSPEGFRQEQAEMGKLWQLVGLTTDVNGDGDWFRGTLAGRSIFVQRFKDEIRGFENVCMHRGYPLRTEDKGNGAIRCGFHHWQYDKEGCAVGIPKCKELFGRTPRELDVRLNAVQIATCGSLVFARFPNDRFRESLEEYLGSGYDILKTMWTLPKAPTVKVNTLKANWRFGHHISLDDYHLVAVHPKTLGKNGYLSTDAVKYYRFGRHSAYFHGADEKALNDMAEQCRNGTYRPYGYRILQFFPNLVVNHANLGNTTFVLLMQYVPVDYDRTRIVMILRESPFVLNEGRKKALIRRAIAPFLSPIAAFWLNKVVGEDNVACEQMQTIARQLDRPQIFGKHEERIAWFEANYADVVGDLRQGARVPLP